MIQLSSKSFLFGLLSCVFLASCGENKDSEMKTQPEELTPSETQGLSLREQEELKIDEDNVMNPFPG